MGKHQRGTARRAGGLRQSPHREYDPQRDGPTTAAPLQHLDSRATLDLARDPVAFKLTKHILRHANELRDRVARAIYEPSFVPTDKQLADILTKGLRPGVHTSLLSLLLDASALQRGSADATG